MTMEKVQKKKYLSDKTDPFSGKKCEWDKKCVCAQAKGIFGLPLRYRRNAKDNHVNLIEMKENQQTNRIKPNCT